MRFQFKGFHDCHSECNIEAMLRFDKLMVIVTELPDNPGSSITNSWPFLADTIYQNVLQRLIDLNNWHSNNQINHNSVIWIEHYLRSVPKLNMETWDRVFMSWDGKNFCDPTWKRIPFETWQRIIPSYWDWATHEFREYKKIIS